jgi:predicted RNase H-like HicB family nuclease
MRYPIAIEVGDETTAYGVVLPDLPGCFSAGDTLDEAVAGAEEAAAAWIDSVLDAGGSVPAPSSLEMVRANPAFAGWSFGVVDVDPAALEDAVERVNIALPRRVLSRLDAMAKSAGQSRSGFIAQMTVFPGNASFFPIAPSPKGAFAEPPASFNRPEKD